MTKAEAAKKYQDAAYELQKAKRHMNQCQDILNTRIKQGYDATSQTIQLNYAIDAYKQALENYNKAEREYNSAK